MQNPTKPTPVAENPNKDTLRCGGFCLCWRAMTSLKHSTVFEKLPSNVCYLFNFACKTANQILIYYRGLVVILQTLAFLQVTNRT